jgi:hypothetical protein
MLKTKFIFLILLVVQIAFSSNLQKTSFVSKSESEDDVVLMATGDISINLSTLSSSYVGVLKIPKDRLKLYQIPEGSSGKYKVTSGSSVTVNTFGTITPRNTTWYWYGGMGSTSRNPNKEPTKIVVEYTEGTSVVTATIGDKSYKITVTVKDYAKEYVENEIDNYIKKNVTVKKTLLDKLKAITAYPAQFPYNGSYYGYMDMIIFKGGDCWASSGTINYMCKKVGIKSHVRFAANDAGAGSGHRNVAALIDGKIYIAEAGFGYTKPNRPYSVTERNVGYSYKTSAAGLTIYQYDGYNEEITVPSSIDGKTVIGLDKPVFYNGGSGVKIKKITIPDTIQTIGNSVFASIPELTTITIPKNVSKIGLYNFAKDEKLVSINVNSANPYFISVDGILYNKNKSQIVGFPPGKKVNYTGISSLTKIGEFSFYYATKVEKVTIPKTVKAIGDGAFAYSGVKEIYFMGDQPEFGQNWLAGLNVTVYYPKGNSKWKTDSLGTFNSKGLRWVQWTPKSAVLLSNLNEENNNSYIFIWVFVAIIAMITLIGMILIFRTRKLNETIVDMDAKGRLVA